MHAFRSLLQQHIQRLAPAAFYESYNYVQASRGGIQRPKPTLFMSFQYVGGANPVTVLEPPIHIRSHVTMNHADTTACD